MSYAPQLAFPFDKDSDLFGQGLVDPCNVFFDQFLTFDSIDHNDNALYPGLDDSTDLVKSFGVSQSAGTPCMDGARSSHLQEPTLDSWDLDLTQNPSTPRLKSAANNNNFYAEESGTAACSDSDILSLEGVSLDSPYVAPLSPSFPSSPKSPVLEATVRRKNRFLDSLSKTLTIPKLRKGNTAPTTSSPEAQRSPIRKVTLGSPVRKVTAHALPEPHRLSPQRSPQRSPSKSPIRKLTSPAKMMRSSQYSDQNLQEWQARLQAEAAKFDFGFQNPQPLSPPPSAKVSDASDSNSNMMTTSDSQHSGFTWDQPVPQYGQRTHDVHTPLATPTAGTHSFSQGGANLQSSSSSNMMYPSTPHHQQHHSQPHPHLSHAQQPGMWGQSQLEDYNPFVASSSYGQEPEAAPVWWSNASGTPLAQPSPTGYHKTPVQDTKTLAMQLQNELVYNASELALSPSSMPQGLMIQMPHSPIHQSFVVSDVHAQHHPQSQQPCFPRPLNPHHDPSTLLLTPRHQRYTSSHPLPIASPQQFQTPQVRKSRSRGHLSESPSPTSRSTSFHVQKQRNRNSSQSRSVSHGRVRGRSDHFPTTPKTPKTPKAGSGFADFVNFTPHDSSKILTGVAPSGSSKTKARREKEAMDKRRRLSQAALRAVQAAGGSIEHLVEEGLLV